MKKLTNLLIVMLFSSLASAFDGERALQIVQTIAADEFEGRRPGFRGGAKAEEYVAGLFQQYGLEPAGDEGYFQKVPLFVTEQQSAQLTLMNHETGKISFDQGTDFTVVTHSGSASTVANVIVVGHGLVRPDKNWDDYGSADVRGKVVLIVRGTPESPWDFDEDFPRKFTLRWAKERGAIGVLWYGGEALVNGAAIPAEDYDPEFPLFYVGDRVVKTLLDGSGYTLKTYKDKLKSGPLPLDVKKEIWLSVKVKKLANPVCRNVLGIVYGTDPVLKNELIVVGGHLDHVGKNSDGVIYNGADDNASGSSVVCELARVIAQAPQKRSVLFMLFTGEEDGLLGSEYFCAHPTIPFGNIVTMLNFDMEGQGNGSVGMSGGELLGPVWTDYVATLDSTAKAKLNFSRTSGGGSSDHASFMDAGAPALGFWSSGEHPFYHVYTDEPAWVSAAVLQAVGDRGQNLIEFLGQRPEALAFRLDSLRLIARMTAYVDLRGFTIDTKSTIPDLKSPAAAWLGGDAKVLTTELMRREMEFVHASDLRQISAGGIAAAVDADRKHKPGAFMGISETALAQRKGYEVSSLVDLGLSVIQLSKADSKKLAPDFVEAQKAAKAAGAYALLPLDFATPARVEDWGNHSIVQTTLGELAALPEDARTGLLNSEALVLCEVSEIPATEQLLMIKPFQARRVHLNIAGNAAANRETLARDVAGELYAVGLKRDEIVRLTAGNLRRFLDSTSNSSGHVDD